MKKIVLLGALLIFSNTSMASTLINDMQTCQAMIQFINTKLNSAPSNYDKGDIKKVRIGLNAYDKYIQTQIIAPGLLKFNDGDKAKATAMQKQVNAYKKGVMTQLNNRYKKNRLFTDYAVMINNCAKKAVPSGNDVQLLKVAVETIVKLAKNTN